MNIFSLQLTVWEDRLTMTRNVVSGRFLAINIMIIVISGTSPVSHDDKSGTSPVSTILAGSTAGRRTGATGGLPLSGATHRTGQGKMS